MWTNGVKKDHSLCKDLSSSSQTIVTYRHPLSGRCLNLRRRHENDTLVSLVADALLGKRNYHMTWAWPWPYDFMGTPGHVRHG